MKKFFSEFKKFITRGNVLDMSVGVIVGGAFTGIVNGLSNYILKPVINWLLAKILGTEGLDGVVTYLSKGYKLDANTGEMVLDLANSIYIDWGAFISAIINFFLIAIVLFSIVRIINKMQVGNKEFMDNLKKGYLNKAERKELKENGVNIKDRKAVKEYLEAKEEKQKIEKHAEEEKAKLEAEEAKKHTTEGLLESIKELLEKQLENK